MKKSLHSEDETMIIVAQDKSVIDHLIGALSCSFTMISLKRLYCVL